MRKIVNFLSPDFFKHTLRAMFATQFVLLTISSLFMSDAETKTKALVSATYGGICCLIQDGFFKKDDRWFNGD